MNPFIFGTPVEGKYYLARPDLDKVVTQFLSHRIHVVLMGPRRFGKTSFILNLLKNLENHGYTCLCIDIFNITSHRDFLYQILRAFKAKKKRLFNIDPLSHQTSFDLSLALSSSKDVKEMIQDVLEGLENLGEKVIVVIDEFQKIAES